MVKKNVCLICLMLICAALFSQNGLLDNTFNSVGKVWYDGNGTQSNDPAKVTFCPDGKIIVVGGGADNQAYDDVVIVRLNLDGSLDSSFANNGVFVLDIFTYDDIASDVIVLPNGKILVCGSTVNDGSSINFEGFVLRLNNNGTLDMSFGNQGLKTFDLAIETQLNSMAIQPDEKIVIGGFVKINDNKDFLVMRLDSAGEYDNTFSGNGKLVTALLGSADDEIVSIEIQSDGKILAAGYAATATYDMAIVRYNTNGTLDDTFGLDGIIVDDEAGRSEYITGLAIDGEGKILVTGESSPIGGGFSDIQTVKYNADGSRDSNFGNNGVVFYDSQDTDLGRDVLVQPNGKIVVVGTTYGNTGNAYCDFIIIRYNSDGSLDNSFGNTGVVLTDFDSKNDAARAAILQPDLRLVVIGSVTDTDSYSSFGVARYLTGLNVGLLDFSQTETAPLLYPNPLEQNETLKFTLAEKEQVTISLIDGQGKLITTFAENQILDRGDHEQILNLPTSLPNGTYFIQIASARGSVSIKTIK